MQKKFFYEKIRQRIAASILVGMLAAVLAVPHKTKMDVTGAWWGVLYPQYCSAAGEERRDGGDSVPGGEKAPRIKIKFRWLHGF